MSRDGLVFGVIFFFIFYFYNNDNDDSDDASNVSLMDFEPFDSLLSELQFQNCNHTKNHLYSYFK